MNVPALHALIRRNPKTAELILANELDWLRWLPNGDQQKCINELIDCAQSATLFPFTRAIKEWKVTAKIWSDPELVRHLRSPLSGEGFPVARPIS